MSYLVFLLFCMSVNAQNFNSEIAETSNLRQEVEVLSAEVEALKKTQQSEMDVYIGRYQEVSSQILKEKFRSEQLKAQITLGRNKLEGHTKKVMTKNAESWLKNFWGQYDASLKKAHPLYAQKLQERLDKLKVDLAFKKISYEHALLQTWFIMESDLSKAQEAEFVLAPLSVKEKLLHVEMVRFGRTKGFLRTADGKFGLLSYKDGWDVQFFEEKNDQKMIETLLTQFKQQQKTGLYALPGITL